MIHSVQIRTKSGTAQFQLETGQAPNKHIDGHYLLFLENDHRRNVVLKSYDRDADILWSPDSSAFIINDYVASDTTIPYLYRVNDLAHPVNISAKFIDSIKYKNDKFSLADSLWLNIFGAKWLGCHSIEVRAVGNCAGSDGRYSPFTLVYSWNLRNTFDRIKRIAKEDWTSDVLIPHL